MSFSISIEHSGGVRQVFGSWNNVVLPRRHPICIAVVSCCVLILELAFIRQVPAEVQAISYFTNLMLMASFFGLGIGCVLHCRRTLFSFFPLGLLMTCAYILVARGIVVYDASREVHFWIHEVAELGVARSFPLFPSALVAFAVSALPFVAMGQELARRPGTTIPGLSPTDGISRAAWPELSYFRPHLLRRSLHGFGRQSSLFAGRCSLFGKSSGACSAFVPAALSSLSPIPTTTRDGALIITFSGMRRIGAFASG